MLTLKGHTDSVNSVAFSPDGKKAFAWDAVGKMLAWSVEDGQPAAADVLPAKPAPGSARAPDGRLAAKPDGYVITIVDLLRPPAPQGDPWPLPDPADRKRYHTEQAALAEKAKQHFSVAFHLGRLLLDDPDNADLKKRRDAALKAHVEAKDAPRKDNR